MTLFMMKLFVLFMMFCATQCAIVFRFGGCPKVTTKSDFSNTPYLGKWYEYERFDNWFELNLKCGYAQYSDNGDGSIGVKNGGVNKRTGKDSTANGRATVPNLAKPGELKVSFSSIADFFSRGANYLVLDTDYTSYVLIFSCTNVPVLPITFQTAWILTRARGVAPPNLASLKATLESYDIPSDKLKRIDQAGCTN